MSKDLRRFGALAAFALAVAPSALAQTLAAAVLPSGRSVTVNATATAYASVINTGPAAATGCRISPVTSVAATFSYQTTNSATNAPTGAPNTPASIPAGGAQSFVFSFTPTAAFAPTDINLQFICNNTAAADIVSGVNTLLLSASASAVPDVIATAATTTNDGVAKIPGASETGFFSTAAVNIGAAGTLTVTPAVLGGAQVNAFVCETNPATGACLAPPAVSVASAFTPNVAHTFSVFLAGNGSLVTPDFAAKRVKLEFRDSNGAVRGATSVAVCTIGAGACSAPPTLQTVQGTVYARSDSVAYGVSVAPASGIAGAPVSLSGVTTNTDGSGVYSLSVPAQSGTGYSMMAASAPGYTTTAYPWIPTSSPQSIPLALYPAVATSARPGFIKGIIPHDVGGIFSNVYNDNLFPPTFDRIKANAGGDVVVLVDMFWVNQLNSSSNSVVLAQSPANGAVMSATNAMYQTLIPQIHQRGLKAMIMLGVFPDPSVGDRFFSEIHVPYSNTAFWSSWFSQYQALAVEKATLAKNLQVEHLALGFNLGFMAQAPVQYWSTMIAAIRATGYTGKLSYFGGTNPIYNASTELDGIQFHNGPAGLTSFLNLFDFIGLNFYSTISTATASEGLALAPEQTRTRIRTSIAGILDKYTSAPVPLVVMIGTPSVHGGAVASDYIEPCLQCGSVAPQRTINLQQQADVYQALCEAISTTPPGNGRVMGVFSWGYHFRDDFSYMVFPGDQHAYDKSANIRGKPAEAVFKNCFQGF